MLTLFSTPKPFRGHFGVIQLNAITSWTRLGPDVEVILFGDDEGTAELCESLGIRHVPDVARNEQGTPLLSDMFLRAQELARHDAIGYSNADILLLPDLLPAVEMVRRWADRFLLVGRRCDVDLASPIDFDRSSWRDEIRSLARTSGAYRPPDWIDYFVFPKGGFPEMPSFAVGRPRWDNWMIWNARERGLPVVDATEGVLAVHQNHDYSHHAGGTKGVWQGVEAERNDALVGSSARYFTIADANYRLTASGMRRNLGPAYLARRLEILRRRLIDWSRPLRHRIGLRQAPGKPARTGHGLGPAPTGEVEI